MHMQKTKNILGEYTISSVSQMDDRPLTFSTFLFQICFTSAGTGTWVDDLIRTRDPAAALSTKIQTTGELKQTNTTTVTRLSH